MIGRLKAAWQALRGGSSVACDGPFIVVYEMAEGQWAYKWYGLGANDAAAQLYRAANAVTHRLFSAQETSRTIH